MAIATTETAKALTPALPLNRPNLVPRLSVGARLKKEVIVVRPLTAPPAREARIAALVSWSRTTTTTAVASPRASITRPLLRNDGTGRCGSALGRPPAALSSSARIDSPVRQIPARRHQEHRES